MVESLVHITYIYVLLACPDSSKCLNGSKGITTMMTDVALMKETMTMMRRGECILPIALCPSLLPKAADSVCPKAACPFYRGIFCTMSVLEEYTLKNMLILTGSF